MNIKTAIDYLNNFTLKNNNETLEFKSYNKDTNKITMTNNKKDYQIDISSYIEKFNQLHPITLSHNNISSNDKSDYLSLYGGSKTITEDTDKFFEENKNLLSKNNMETLAENKKIFMKQSGGKPVETGYNLKPPLINSDSTSSLCG
jgi:hypothetical protein